MSTDLQIAEWINQHRIKGLDGLFIFLTDTAGTIAYAVPIILILYALYKHNVLLRMKGLQILSTLLLSTIIVQLIKHIIHRKRPYEVDKIIQKLSYGGGYSFPSGHTADAFALAIAITLVVTKRRWILIPLYIWAVTVAYSRMLLGVHYLTDILASICISFLCAVLMQFLYNRKKEQAKQSGRT